jgi:hypothetical protein
MNANMHGPEAVMKLLQGAQATALLSAAIDLGVFGAISNGAHASGEIAATVKAPARSTGMLLDGRWLGAAGLEVVEIRANMGMPSSIVIAEKRS